ncbi:MULTISPECIES: hypothetical protein [unclassified Desulfovibrio]|uniref:hypothetical protein n=1 Tax=unclassified Desulfovibrio TaxID=2593640 RepID=UPI00163953F8|nr:MULTISPECIES: hypothetical protein [unclassified Desulfovibrio]
MAREKVQNFLPCHLLRMPFFPVSEKNQLDRKNIAEKIFPRKAGQKYAFCAFLCAPGF